MRASLAFASGNAQRGHHEGDQLMSSSATRRSEHAAACIHTPSVAKICRRILESATRASISNRRANSPSQEKELCSASISRVDTYIGSPRKSQHRETDLVRHLRPGGDPTAALEPFADRYLRRFLVSGFLRLVQIGANPLDKRPAEPL